MKEVLDLLEAEEEFDMDEVLLIGSDEEFDEVDQDIDCLDENGIAIFNNDCE